MKPLINSEGHLRALEDYVKFLANGPSEQIGWTLEQGWSPFLSGHAVMEPTWGDLPTLTQNRAHSSVQGRVDATNQWLDRSATKHEILIRRGWNRLNLRCAVATEAIRVSV
jgi:hypothetical protein